MNNKDFNLVKIEERVHRNYCLTFHSFGNLELKKSIDIVKNNNNKIRYSLVLRIYLTSGEEIVIHSYFSTKYQDKTVLFHKMLRSSFYKTKNMKEQIISEVKKFLKIDINFENIKSVHSVYEQVFEYISKDNLEYYENILKNGTELSKKVGRENYEVYLDLEKCNTKIEDYIIDYSKELQNIFNNPNKSYVQKLEDMKKETLMLYEEKEV